jgi:hypothetical protein
MTLIVPSNGLHDFESADLVTTPQGAEWLEENPDFMDLLEAYCSTVDEPETLFNIEGVNHIGWGSNSLVVEYGGLALKLSTPSTGRQAWDRGDPVKPEDMIGQLRFLDGLGEHLAKGKSNVSTTEQYLALNGPFGNLRLEEHKIGYATLGRTLFDRLHNNKNQRFTIDEEVEIIKKERQANKIVRTRVGNAVGHTVFALGMDFGRRLHNDNVLVPVGVDIPEDGPLCVIDQPSRNIFGSFAMSALSIKTSLSNRRN